MVRIFLVGYMGAGKTTIGKLLCQDANLNFVDLDTYIERKYFKTISQLFDEHGESGFRIIEQQCLREVADFEDVVIATGGGTPCFFDNMSYMNERGTTIYLKYPAEELASRLANATTKRPLIANKSIQELAQFVDKMLKEREPYYEQASLVLSGEENEIVRNLHFATNF
jgi:shikimate kinase